MAVGGGIALSAVAKSLIRSGLFGKDFDSYVAEIVDFLDLRFGSEVRSNIVASEMGVVTIEMMAFALSTMSWYGDRQADDTNLRDVRIRSAAVVIARQLGYVARAAVPPAVDVEVTLLTPPPSRLTIEKGRALIGPNGLSFETISETIFDVGEVGPKTITVRQGESLEELFVSDGQPDQVFQLTTIPEGSSLAQDSPAAFIAAIEWTENPILTFEQINQFEVQYGFDPPRLLFGDGVAGNIPPKDAEIRVQFFVTDGTGGSVPANSITAFAEPLVAGITPIAATVTHADPTTPGSEPETIASIKANAPLVFQAAQRAVTQADLDGWINGFIDPTFGAVAIGRATVPRGVNEDAEALSIIQDVENAGAPADVVTRLRDYWDDVLASNCRANVVLAQILAADSVGRYVAAPEGLARALETFLDAKAESTVKVHVTDGTINLLSVDLTVEIKTTVEFSSQEQQEAVVADVKSALEAELLGRSYGDSLRISDLYRIADEIEGVDFAHITVTNQPARVNSHGDLPIESFEVITLGVSPTITLLL